MLEFSYQRPLSRYRMKKLQQSVGAGRQIALQKMERRNCQKNTIIGPDAHAAPESQKGVKMQEPASIILSVKEPKKVKGTTKKTGMISLKSGAYHRPTITLDEGMSGGEFRDAC